MSDRLKPDGATWQESTEVASAPTKQVKFALSDMADEWHFFNHGALFCYGGMRYGTSDPVADWFAQQPRGTEVIMQPFRRLLFGGLDAPVHIDKLTWGNVTLAIRREHWASLFAFLSGIATIDRRERLFSQTFSKDVAILDPVLVERYNVFDPAVKPISVTVFCVETNKDRWQVQPAKSIAGIPAFVRQAPSDSVVQMARAVLSGELDELQYKHHPVIQQVLDKHKGADFGHQNDNAKLS